MSLVLDRPQVLVRDLMTSDLSASASLHRRAFPDGAISLLGHEMTRRFHSFLSNGPFELVGLGAFEGGKLAAFCFGGSVRDIDGAFLRHNFWFVAGRVCLRPWLLFRAPFRHRVWGGFRSLLPRARRRGSRSITTPGGEPVPSFGVLYVVVDPSHQGRGIARRLLVESENVANARGFARMDLAVLPDNHAAIGLYEQMGWERLPEDGAWRGLMFKSLA